MKYLICLLLALSLVGCGGGSTATLTQNNLDKVQNDMSPAQVESILGKPTTSKSEPIPLVGGTQTTYNYSNNNSQVTVIFKNDKVTDKSGTFAP